MTERPIEVVEETPHFGFRLPLDPGRVAYGRIELSSDDVARIVGAAAALLGMVDGLPDDPNLQLKSASRILEDGAHNLREILVEIGAIKP
jgi:hypothetical protein